MQETNLTAKTIYRPIPFLLSVFSITWLCAFLMTITDYNAHPVPVSYTHLTLPTTSRV